MSWLEHDEDVREEPEDREDWKELWTDIGGEG
jgi:hypothetical protein